MKLSKRDREEEVTTAWGISTLADAIIFCSSETFEESIDEFREEHSGIFQRYARSVDPENEEQSLECTESFQQYQKLIESLLEEFVSNKGVTIREFYAECKSAIDGDFTPLFQDHEHKWFVDIILSWLDYSFFFKEMVSYAASRSRSEGKVCHK